MITILGLDPGSKNMAWSIIDMHTPTRFKIKQVGMIQNAITDMKGEVKPRAAKFKREIQSKIKLHKVNLIVAERFQARGIKGNTGEYIAMMLGIITTQRPNCMFITASQWKNKFNQHCDLKSLYKASKLKPHEIDSTSIAIYGGAKHFGEDHPFRFAAKKSFKYIKVIEGCSQTLESICSNKRRQRQKN